ncbi:hypothetical protein KSF_009730 [Reticulibacter mediterranei]|uniref:ClbS/DfsB family four-helix bundle protein n=1 Tax=Reticulibacter mediterranei TaxID=2778369 RepID=A0A8J3N067_9CHLR|nr:hypothetical protein [Reticulibacter mediterranei]GHO90925.1 hypothetical protein KSF_009730 [Reticulibacter mediterranei]
MTERIDLLQSLADAHERLITPAMKAAARGVNGSRGPREVLAHIVGWEVIAIACLPGLLPGEAPAPLTYDAMNLAMVTLIGEQPIEVFRDMLYQTHQRFLNMPEVQDEASFVPGHPIFERTLAAIGHCVEHVRELDRSSGQTVFQ